AQFVTREPVTFAIHQLPDARPSNGLRWMRLCTCCPSCTFLPPSTRRYPQLPNSGRVAGGPANSKSAPLLVAPRLFDPAPISSGLATLVQIGDQHISALAKRDATARSTPLSAS